MNTYQGSCHCGAVTYSIEADIASAVSCNCSYCYRKGMLLTFMAKSQFTLNSGADNLTEYLFNKKHISHLFCKTCGVQCFSYGTDAEGNETVAVNVRTLTDFEAEGLEIHEYDGKSA